MVKRNLFIVLCCIVLCSCSKNNENDVTTREAEIISKEPSMPQAQASTGAGTVNQIPTGVTQIPKVIEVRALIANVDKDLESEKAYPFQEGKPTHKKARLLRTLDTYKKKYERDEHILELALDELKNFKKPDRIDTLITFFSDLLAQIKFQPTEPINQSDQYSTIATYKPKPADQIFNERRQKVKDFDNKNRTSEQERQLARKRIQEGYEQL